MSRSSRSLAAVDGADNVHLRSVDDALRRLRLGSRASSVNSITLN